MVKTVVPKNQLLSPEVYKLIQRSMPVACVDLVIVRTSEKGRLETLLIKRKIFPEAGKWCLVGGRILKNERIEDAIKRQAGRELGVQVKIFKPWTAMFPLRVDNVLYADIRRHYISLLYPVRIISGVAQFAGPEFSEAQWFAANKIPAVMGFRHREQVLSALRQIKNQKSPPPAAV